MHQQTTIMERDISVPETVLWSCLETMPTTGEIQAATMLSLVLGAAHSYAARSMLWAIFRVLRPNYIIETGTNHGLTSAFMRILSKQVGSPSVRTVTFDIAASTLGTAAWERLEAAKDITFVHGDSAAMIPRACTFGTQFALIDGDHSYRGAERDWRAIEPLLAESSIVFFDNMQHEGGCGAFAMSLRPIWFHPEMAIVIRGLTGSQIQQIIMAYVQRNPYIWLIPLASRACKKTRNSLRDLLALLEGSLQDESECGRAASLCRALSTLADLSNDLRLSEKMASSVRYGIGTSEEIRRQKLREALPYWLFRILSKAYRFVKCAKHSN